MEIKLIKNKLTFLNLFFNKLALLIFMISGLMFNEVNAANVNHWELIPQSSIEIEGNTLYTYSGMVLTSRRVDTFCEILLNIKDSRNKQKFTQLWIKSKLESGQVKQYSLGDEVLVLINAFNSKELIITDPEYIQEGVSFEAPWLFTDEKNWIISDNIIPISNAPITLRGMDYSIYSGEIVSFAYQTRAYDGNTSSDSTYLDFDLDIDVKFEGEGKHYIEHRHCSVCVAGSNGKWMPQHIIDNDTDSIIRILRNWKTSDQIKILVNIYYPGFWWIINESRNEAIFVAQGHAIDLIHDIWGEISF
jgi:hypothetical protein